VEKDADGEVASLGYGAWTSYFYANASPSFTNHVVSIPDSNSRVHQRTNFDLLSLEAGGEERRDCHSPPQNPTSGCLARAGETTVGEGEQRQPQHTNRWRKGFITPLAWLLWYPRGRHPLSPQAHHQIRHNRLFQTDNGSGLLIQHCCSIRTKNASSTQYRTSWETPQSYRNPSFPPQRGGNLNI